jgi:hypothetical protein
MIRVRACAIRRAWTQFTTVTSCSAGSPYEMEILRPPRHTFEKQDQ